MYSLSCVCIASVPASYQVWENLYIVCKSFLRAVCYLTYVLWLLLSSFQVLHVFSCLALWIAELLWIMILCGFLLSSLFYSFLHLSARGELPRATSAGNHAQLHQGTANMRGTDSALSWPACPRTTGLLKRRQRSLRRRRLHFRQQATKNKSFPGQYIVWTRKKEKAKGLNPFPAFQVPFWFPALRSPILSSAMVVVAFQHHLHNNAFSLLFFLIGLLSYSLSLSLYFFSSSLVFYPVLSFFFRPHRSFVVLFLFMQKCWTHNDSNIHTCLKFEDE